MIRSKKRQNFESYPPPLLISIENLTYKQRHTHTYHKLQKTVDSSYSFFAWRRDRKTNKLYSQTNKIKVKLKNKNMKEWTWIIRL